MLNNLFRHFVLSRERRQEPLEGERTSAQIGQGISQGMAPESPSNPLRLTAKPPLRYAVTDLSKSGQSEQPGGATTTSNSGQARGVVHGLMESVLARSLPHEVQDLLADARRHGAERREYGREPYLHPAVVEFAESGERHSAFIRDVSPGGLGLLHFVTISPQRIRVLTRRMNDEIINVAIEIAWCVPCGEGCFMSGGSFVQNDR